MQFLMGLNDSCDLVRNQIRLMDLLPSIKKVYFMILRVKKQREIHVSLLDNVENNVMMAKSGILETLEVVKKIWIKRLTRKAWIIIVTIVGPMIILNMQFSNCTDIQIDKQGFKE